MNAIRSLSLLSLLLSLPVLGARSSVWQQNPGQDVIAGQASPIPVGADGKYTIESEGLRLQFIPYGASITNLFINDTKGVERDIVLGYDNATHYPQDTSHPHLGGVPGRYANRIKNSTFVIDGHRYNVPPNENHGADTLHGGPNGWDYRQFKVVYHSRDSIIFSITDSDGTMGFPGTVDSFIHYKVTPYRWHLYMNATSDKLTPIMLTSHTYWNLDGFQNPDTNNALQHIVSLPFSGQRIEVDNILIPTGKLLPNTPNSVNDFWSTPKDLGASFGNPDIKGNCGSGCSGYDTCFIVNRDSLAPYVYNALEDGSSWWQAEPVASVRSNWSGIELSVYTEQDAFQMYSCNGQNGTMPLKKTQGFFDDNKHPRTVAQYGCVVLEVQDWIDGINNPAWLRATKQTVGPNTPPYEMEAMYEFSVTK